jgi:hypothetical protein
MQRIAPGSRWLAFWPVAALAVGVVILSPPSAAGPVEGKPTPPDLVQAVESARRLGQLLYLYDKDAADASDAAEQFASGRADPPVRGWIVERDNGAATVTFFAEQGGQPFPVYHVYLRDATASPVVEPAATVELPTSEQRSIWLARKTALSANVTRCSRAYNTVVLRGDAMKLAGWLVYLIPATAEPGRVLVGGYYRVHVSARGDKLLSVTPFSKSCLAIPAPEASPGAQAVGAYFNHLLSDAPTETHVFLSKLHRKPMYVATPRGVWSVDGDAITFLGTPR